MQTLPFIGQVLLIVSVPLLLSDLFWLLGAISTLLGVWLFESPIWLVPLWGSIFRLMQQRAPTGVRDRMRMRILLSLLWMAAVFIALQLISRIPPSDLASTTYPLLLSAIR